MLDMNRFGFSFLLTIFLPLSFFLFPENKKILWYRVLMIWFSLGFLSFALAFLLPGHEPYEYNIKFIQSIGAKGLLAKILFYLGIPVIFMYGFVAIGILEIIWPSSDLSFNKNKFLYFIGLFAFLCGTLNMLVSLKGINGFLGLIDTVLIGTILGFLLLFRPSSILRWYVIFLAFLQIIFVALSGGGALEKAKIEALGYSPAWLGPWTDWAITLVASGSLISLGLERKRKIWRKTLIILGGIFFFLHPIFLAYAYIDLWVFGNVPEKIKPIVECQKSENPSECFYLLGKEKKDVGLCERIPGFELSPPFSGNRAICIKGVAEATGEEKICDLIKKESLRKECKENSKK